MKFLTILPVICFLSLVSYAQEEDSGQNNSATEPTQNEPEKIIKPRPSLEELYKDKNLSEQFLILTEKSESYNDYKVIKKSSLNNFWRMVQDSISILKQNISSQNEIIANQNTDTKTLESIITKKDEELSNTNFAMTHITFWGIDFSKSTFITINVILILGLAGMLSLGFFQYHHNKIVTIQKIKECNALENDFEDFRKNSLEKQIKLNRDLQTERNILEEIRSKSTITKKMHA